MKIRRRVTMRRALACIGSASLAFAVPFAALAQTAGGEPAQTVAGGKPSSDVATERNFTKKFTGRFGGERFGYTAEAGETYVRGADGEPLASIFSVSYVRDNAATDRPVIFAFNGGPGTSSLFLHIGFLGPKTVAVPSDATQAGNPPFRIGDNANSLLDVADLVFIDPVGTGYSRALGGKSDKDYWGVREDARSITDFMGTWLTRHRRWNAPKYILGESYGTIRAVQIVEEFQRAFTGAMPNGVILLSSALDLQSIVFSPGNDQPFVAFLPTYAATALYHGKVVPAPEDRKQFLQAASDFAVDEYSVALLKGATLPADERRKVIEKLSYFTGLSEAFIERSDLRVTMPRFRKELLRDRGQMIGLLDARYLGEDTDNAGATPDSDPASTGIENAYVSAYLDYLTGTLGVTMASPYKAYGRDVFPNWKWSDPGALPTGFNVGHILGETMRRNNRFRVFHGDGVFDLSTPIFATELAFTHNGIKKAQVVRGIYNGGHMMYTHGPSASELASDLRRFVRNDGVGER